MANKLVIANHKMNMEAKDLNNYLKELEVINNKNVVICPTSIYIPYFLIRKYNFHSKSLKKFMSFLSIVAVF